MNIEKIKQTVELASREDWPYPKLFDALKEAGVTAYEVTVEPYKRIYYSTKESWEAPTSPKNPALKIDETFSASMLQAALAKHQREKTTYEDFLHGAALAGVDHYQVDMANRTVTYFGINPMDCHIESIPVFS